MGQLIGMKRNGEKKRNSLKRGKGNGFRMEQRSMRDARNGMQPPSRRSLVIRFCELGEENGMGAAPPGKRRIPGTCRDAGCAGPPV